MSTSVPAATAAGLIAAVARVLADRGRDGAGEALLLVREGLGLVGAVLRDEEGDVVSAAAVPHQRSRCRTIDVPVRAGDRVHGWLTISTPDPITVDQAAALTGVADVLALCLDAESAHATAEVAREEVAQAVLDDEADRAAVAAALRDRVGDVLVALGYSAARVADGRADPAGLTEPIRVALTAFRTAQRDLRALALEGGLRAALAEIAAHREADRLDDGLPVVRVEVDATDPALDRLPAAVAVTVQRFAEVSLRGATGRIRLRATVDGPTVKLSVDSADIAYDAGELGRWERRVRALGGQLWPGPDGVELSLPAASEGSHDDRPDL